MFLPPIPPPEHLRPPDAGIQRVTLQYCQFPQVKCIPVPGRVLVFIPFLELKGKRIERRVILIPVQK